MKGVSQSPVTREDRKTNSGKRDDAAVRALAKTLAARYMRGEVTLREARFMVRRAAGVKL